MRRATTAARPVIGLTCCTRQVGPEAAQAVMNRYVEAATAYADVAVLLAPSRPDLMSAREVAGRLDGVLLTGSPSNVDPERYGDADDGRSFGPYDHSRDQMALDLVEAMLDLGRPVFGICRGLQELNVALGGQLRRDTSSNPNLIAHHAADDASFDEMFGHHHEVALTPGGVLAQSLGVDRMMVNSVHYQGIQRLGSGLQVEARAPDGVVEAVSGAVNGAAVLAVQWHPEWRVDANPESQDFFRLLGRAVRGEWRSNEVRTTA